MATRFSNVRTLLFDVDGTLLDTTELIFQAYEHATKEAGVPTPDRQWLRFQIGRELGAVYRDVAPEQVAQLVEIHRDFQASHLDLSKPFEGVGDTLSKLRRAGMHMAAVTSRSNRTSVQSLELAGIARYFPVIISAEDAPALKPDPAPLLVALEKLNQPQDTAAMVGDAMHDIHAAQALGIRAIAATYGFPGAEVLNYRPDGFIADIRDLPMLLGA